MPTTVTSPSVWSSCGSMMPCVTAASSRPRKPRWVRAIGYASCPHRMPSPGGAVLGHWLSGQTAENISEDHAQALRGIRRVAKELLGVGVERMCDGRFAAIMIHHLAQAGGEDLWVEGTLQDILAGLAGLLNR